MEVDLHEFNQEVEKSVVQERISERGPFFLNFIYTQSCYESRKDTTIALLNSNLFNSCRGGCQAIIPLIHGSSLRRNDPGKEWETRGEGLLICDF